MLNSPVLYTNKPFLLLSVLFSVSQAGYIFGTFLTCFGSLVIAHDRQLCRALGFWVNKTLSDKVTLSIPLSLTFTQICPEPQWQLNHNGKCPPHSKQPSSGSSKLHQQAVCMACTGSILMWFLSVESFHLFKDDISARQCPAMLPKLSSTEPSWAWGIATFKRWCRCMSAWDSWLVPAQRR